MCTQNEVMLAMQVSSLETLTYLFESQNYMYVFLFLFYKP